MFITKITRLIQVIVLLLPCVQAQYKEYTFIRSMRDLDFNVSENEEIVLGCITEINAPIKFKILEKNLIDGYTIIENSKLLQEYSDRFKHEIIHNEFSDRHEITIKNTYRDQVDYSYQCIDNDRYALKIILNIRYPPTPPTCMVIESEDGLFVYMCGSELGNPPIDMMIAGPNSTHVIYTELGDDYITKNIVLDKYVDGITCTTTYKFMQYSKVYTKEFCCDFKDTHTHTHTEL